MRFSLSVFLVPLSLTLFGVQQVEAAPFDSIVPALETRDFLFSPHALQTRDLPTGTCNADTPCKLLFVCLLPSPT